MKTPVIVLNLKTYPEATGTSAVTLVETAARLAAEKKKRVVVCPQSAELAWLSAQFPATEYFQLFAQHADAAASGAFTGAMVPATLSAHGIRGSLLNHAEKKIGMAQVEKALVALASAGLETIVCADSVDEAKKIASFAPPCIAVEPPELIGKGISVSTAQPEIVTGSVEQIRAIHSDIRVLVGAGVSTAEDVATSISLGAQGVLLASAFVKSRNPALLLEEMLDRL